MSNIAHVYVNGEPVSDTNPLPTSGGGGGGAGDVNLTQVAGVAVTHSGGTLGVNVQNTPAVTVSGTTTVGGTVAVSSVGGTVATTLSGTPAVNVAQLDGSTISQAAGVQNVSATISGTPTVNVGSVGGSAVSQSAGVQNVAVTNALSLHPVNVTQIGSSAISQSAGVQNVNATVVSLPAPTGTTATNVTQLAGVAISQSAGVQDMNVSQVGGQAVSAQNSIPASNLRGIFPLAVRDDTRASVALDGRSDILRTDARGAMYANCDLRYVNGFSVAATDGNVPVTINNPLSNGTSDNIDMPNGVILAPAYTWNSVNQRFDRVRGVVTTFSATNRDFTTTVDRHLDTIVFGLTCNGNERIVKVYRIGVQVNQTNASTTNCIALRYYKGIDTGSGSAIALDSVNHDNAFGGANGNNLSPTALPVLYPGGASGGGFIDGTIRAGNTYVNGTLYAQEWDFGTPPRQPLICRGDKNGIVLVNASDFGDPYILTVWVEWTEETIDQAVP